MKISRERIERIRNAPWAGYEIADLMTALDERDELLAQVRDRLVARTVHRQIYDDIAEILRGTKYER